HVSRTRLSLKRRRLPVGWFTPAPAPAAEKQRAGGEERRPAERARVASQPAAAGRGSVGARRRAARGGDEHGLLDGDRVPRRRVVRNARGDGIVRRGRAEVGLQVVPREKSAYIRLRVGNVRARQIITAVGLNVDRERDGSASGLARDGDGKAEL